MIDSTIGEIMDDMAIMYGLTAAQIGYGSSAAGTLPAAVTPTYANQNLGGVIAFSRKTSLNQVQLDSSTRARRICRRTRDAPGGELRAVGCGHQLAATASILVGQIVPTAPSFRDSEV